MTELPPPPDTPRQPGDGPAEANSAIACPHCYSEDVDPAATHCPHCGQRLTPWWTGPKIAVLFGVAALVLIVVGAAYSASQTDTASSSSFTTVAEPTTDYYDTYDDTYGDDLSSPAGHDAEGDPCDPAIWDNCITDDETPTDPPATIPLPTDPPTTPPPPDTVTYECSGNAPAGIDITYGASGSNVQATSLPFSHTDPLDPNAMYVVVTAQLQGSGQVTCTTTVTVFGAPLTQTATASGGYNIASAQICSTFSGGWDAC
jgi:hypothetical protein